MVASMGSVTSVCVPMPGTKQMFAGEMLELKDKQLLGTALISSLVVEGPMGGTSLHSLTPVCVLMPGTKQMFAGGVLVMKDQLLLGISLHSLAPVCVAKPGMKQMFAGGMLVLKELLLFGTAGTASLMMEGSMVGTDLRSVTSVCGLITSGGEMLVLLPLSTGFSFLVCTDLCLISVCVLLVVR